MKNKLLLFVLSLLILNFSIVEGQSKYYRRLQPKVSYGVKGGLNFASQSSPGNEAGITVKHILAINAGGYATHFFNKSMAVQTELMVSGKGSNWKDYSDNMKDILTYIDLNFLFKYQPVKYLNIHAGPQVSYRLSATQKDLKLGMKSDIKDYYKSIDYEIVFGAEVNLPYKINFTVRYVLGPWPATTSVKYISPWYNNYFQFSVGYRLSGK